MKAIRSRNGDGMEIISFAGSKESDPPKDGKYLEAVPKPESDNSNPVTTTNVFKIDMWKFFLAMFGAIMLSGFFGIMLILADRHFNILGL